MAVKRIVTALSLLLLITGCSTVQAERDAPFLAPASGGTVMMASVPKSRPAPAYPSYATWRFDDLGRFTKWLGVLERLDALASLPPRWRARKAELKALPVGTRAQMVNRMVNAYRYIEDDGDEWLAPDEFFARGGGDCEDFAIAKYALLRDLGVPEDNLRVVVVYDRYLKNMHALLSVRTGTPGDVLLLDNQIAQIRPDRAARRYRPIFGLGRDAWWLYGEVGAA